MSDYDVGKAFARIEREIIASMMRNMDNHRAEEDKEGKKWPQWQAMQLKSLEKFKKDNRKKYDFSKINMVIDDLIQEAYDKGGMEEEVKILKQIKKLHGNSVTNAVKSKISDIKQRLTPGVNQEFFGLNREKVDKLIKATHSDMEKVEQAMLRKADDQYRKIIFNAQMADISGAFTYEQAVDMAAKDFLNAGLNCVEYKNGRRVTAKTYAEMAIRTANARATLMAEGEKRHQLGITTVIVGHNGSACPLCQKWLGKVLIDDVYSGGKPTDGDYPLLSTAMKEGLFHPNCRDVIGTYIPGITRLPEPPKPEERQLSFDVYNLEQKEKQAKHNAERMGRLGDNSLDKNNKRMYKHREKMWKEKVEEYEGEKKLLEKTIKNSTIKSLDADDFEMLAYGKNILQEVSDVIVNTIEEFENRGEMYIFEVHFGDFYDEDTGKPALFQVFQNAFGMTEMNVNSRILGGKTINEIDEIISSVDVNIPKSLKEAVVHECGHAKAYFRKTPQQIAEMNDEIRNKGVGGISYIAERDGAECIAETEVLLYRKEAVPEAAMELYNEYVVRKKK